MVVGFGVVEELTEVLVGLHHCEEEFACTIIALFTLVMSFMRGVTIALFRALISQRLAAELGRTLLGRGRIRVFARRADRLRLLSPLRHNVRVGRDHLDAFIRVYFHPLLLSVLSMHAISLNVVHEGTLVTVSAYG